MGGQNVNLCLSFQLTGVQETCSCVAGSEREKYIKEIYSEYTFCLFVP